VREHLGVRQIPGESKRRWFSSNDFDLFVWVSNDQGFTGFELCYDKFHNEHSIIWKKGSHISHMAVDDGENTPGKYKQSPILVSDGVFDVKRIYSAFLEASQTLPKEVANFVLQALEQHPDLRK